MRANTFSILRLAGDFSSALNARAKPMDEFNSSTVPHAQMRGESLLTRLPPTSPVVPSSPRARVDFCQSLVHEWIR